MKPSKVETDGFTSYTYSLGENDVELTISYDKMVELCEKHNLQPDVGAGEALFDAFCDWLYLHKENGDLFNMLTYDILSIVYLFNEDLLNTAKIEAYEKKKD